ncbi:MAG: Endonuclease, partial [Bryobacterales bacterium]|nr:Endonuclease [Bryobacterales bacterium]
CRDPLRRRRLTITSWIDVGKNVPNVCVMTHLMKTPSSRPETTVTSAGPRKRYHGFLRIGIHTSTAGALENAALEAGKLGANTFQIFSSSPRMWRASIPNPVDIAKFRKAREQFDLYPLAIHVSYLINLATLDPVIREKSIAGFRGELERAVAIGAEYLVTHPGNYKSRTLHEGIAGFVLGMAEAAQGLKTRGLTVLLENTVGSGAQIGSRFEELHMIRELAKTETDLDIAYCLDTCHLFAAGFNIATAEGLKKTVAHADEILGLANVKLIHTNDSKGALGSRLDRHENIGKGHIGAAGFRRILNHPGLRDKPFILETPVDEEGDDRRNVEALTNLCVTKNAGKAVRL